MEGAAEAKMGNKRQNAGSSFIMSCCLGGSCCEKDGDVI